MFAMRNCVFSVILGRKRQTSKSSSAPVSMLLMLTGSVTQTNEYFSVLLLSFLLFIPFFLPLFSVAPCLSGFRDGYGVTR